ncbi:MAG TPA: cytochrome c [Candidatus Methylomirabilis sp.]|nr:cytochrome c [Candidatus Methylomirabilis sp.]
MKHALALAAVLLLLPLAVWAADQKAITLPPDNDMAALKPGPGMEVARANCVVCHSTDYVVLQPKGDAKQWQAVVTKMIKVFGAPVAPENEKTIVDYLSAAYAPAR